MFSDPYEPYLHRRLLAQGRALAADPQADPQEIQRVARQVFDLLLSTNADPLAVTAGAVLRELANTALQPTVIQWVLDAVTARRRGQLLRLFIDDPAVFDTLLTLLSDPNPPTRMYKGRVEAPIVISPSVQAALLARINDPNPHMRVVVIQMLHKVASDPVVRSALLNCLADPERFVRRRAIGALEPAADDPEVQQAVLPLLADESLVGGGAASLLRTVATDPTVRRAILAQLVHPGGEVCLPAAWALNLVAPYVATVQKGLRTALLPQFADSSPRKRLNAVRALAPIATDPVVRDALLALLQDPDRWVRKYAIEAMEHIAEDLVVQQAVRPILNDTDNWARVAAVRVLRHCITDPVIQPSLLALLADPETSIREGTAGALGGSAAVPAVRAALVDRLNDADGWVIAVTVWGLRPFAADPEILAALRTLLMYPHDDVLEAVAAALEYVPPDPALREWLGALLDRCPIAANAAYTTLLHWAEIEDTARAGV